MPRYKHRAGLMTAAVLGTGLSAALPAVARVEPPAAPRLTVRALADFGAKCDGASDDAAAFAAATAWLGAAGNRLVHLPAATCATSATVTVGDGRQVSTTLSSGLSGGETAIPVASIAGIQDGDRIVVVNDAGAVVNLTVSGTPAAGSVPITGSYSGGAAASGNTVYAGSRSTYDGAGFVGYGGCQTTGTAALPYVSKIKYIGPAAPSTTLGATANAGDLALTVASTSGIGIGDPLRVTLDSGVTFWTFVRETPSGTTVEIANEVPSTATSGNAVLVANNPVARIAGPILSARFENVCLDANNLAAVGLDAVQPFRGSFRRVMAMNYTGIGHYYRTMEAYLLTASGLADNDFEPYTLQPDNNQTIGCWYRGSALRNMAFSRNRFHGGQCMMGGKDAPAAAIREEFIDNNTFIKAYAAKNAAPNTAGAGLYRQPSVNKSNFPNENIWLSPALIGGVTDGTATGGTIGNEYASAYAVYDAEPIPNSSTFAGTTTGGLPFGTAAPRDYFAGLKLSKLAAQQVSIAAGSVSTSGNVTLLQRGSACNINLLTNGDRGIDTGAVAADTWYAVFLIGPFSTGIAGCLATATTAAAVPTPTLPAGFTYYGYVGRFKTDASSNVNAMTILPRGQFYIDAGDTYTPGASGFRPTSVRLVACGGGASGASGGRQVSGTAISGGTGGSGGGCMDITYPYDLLASSLSVTVGAGGAAVAAPGTNSTPGNAGNPGNPTFFGASAATAIAYGGAGCAGDGGRLNATAASGGSGAGTTNTSSAFSLCTAGSGGTIGAGMQGGANGSVAATGTVVTQPGAGAPGGGSTTTGSSIGSSTGGRFACAGGGAGGTVTSAPASVNGGAGGMPGDGGIARGTGGTAGTPTGGNGNNSTTIPFLPGSGGGGGYGNSAGAAGAGGTGGQCAGGGGGGSALNGSNAGGGGKGGDGFAYVWELR